MRLRSFTTAGLAVFFLAAASALQSQSPFRPVDSSEADDDAPFPSDAQEKTEWAFARLRYPNFSFRGFGGYGRYRGYRGFRGSWATDAPKADRQFVLGVRRLTRLHTRSAEQVVDLDSDDVYNWPWIYGVEVGHWELTDAQCRKMREYLLRGGFFMCDDFHGTEEWEVFINSMSRVFPDRPIVEIDNKDAIFHVIYDLDDRVQVPGIQYFPKRAAL